MPVPLEQFVQQLEDSGIVAGDTLREFIPPQAAPHDAEDLARELVRQKKLTRFQAEEVCKGNAAALVLGNYVLLEKIGAGGMGQVFKARHRRMDRIVAVKLLPTAMTQDQAAIARFEREVKAAARLNHPNIVTAYDADCANGVHFLVMEYVEGSDLAALVKKHGPLSVEQAIPFIVQAARGLQAAHAEGIVHRDIKPGNLLLDKKGAVKVLDMGLARIDAAADEATQAELTRAGIVMGTVDYMAPEQARDTKSADARADIYSLGCTLHYLLTGKNVYTGETLMAKLVAHRTKPVPSLRAVRPDVPEQLNGVFQKMLAKDVAERYQSMREVIAALQPTGQDHQPPAALDETRQFAAEQTHTGLADFLQHMEIEPQPPVAARKSVAAGKPLLNKDWLTNNRTLLLIGAGILGVLLLAGMIASLQSPESRPTAPSNDFAVRVEVPVDHHAAAGNGSLAFESPGFDDWVRQVADLPAEDQVKAVVRKLQELNQGYDGKETHEIESGVVTKLTFVTDSVTDISPVRALAGLRSLICVGARQGKLADLAPIQGMAITSLYVGVNRVLDLSALNGMPLTSFNCQNTEVSDLSPLIGMRLNALSIHGSQVSDLSPLKDMPLTSLNCQYTPVTDLSPLHGLPLTQLSCSGTQVSDLSPLQGMPLAILDCSHNPTVSDFSPLKELPLKLLGCDFNRWRDIDILRSIETLEEINGRPEIEFWQDVEAQQAAFDEWLKQVATLPAEEQVKSVVKKLQELNPDYDGQETHQVDNGVVMELQFNTDTVTDISPVRALPQLERLLVSGNWGQGKLADLSPLAGMPLKSLSIYYTKVADLSPLAGMPLNHLRLEHTQASDLTPLIGMQLTVLDVGGTKVSDISPLAGMPLTSLGLNSTQVTDLSTLQSMPLTTLNIAGTAVTDLSPLINMSLTILDCPFTLERDADILRSVTTLKQINLKPAADFWQEIDAQQAAFDAWAKEVAVLPAEEQVKALMKRMQELNPEFDGQEKHTVRDGAVFELHIVTDHVTDISPLRALPSFYYLSCTGSEPGNGKLTDLSPLRSVSVTLLTIHNNPVADLSPLAGMKSLRSLDCGVTQVADLSPLRRLKLLSLDCPFTKVVDLTPLEDMKLEHLTCQGTGVADLTALQGMPLTTLRCDHTQVADLAPLQGMPLVELVCVVTRVSDFSPIEGCPLQRILFDFCPYRDAELLRSITTLERINVRPAADFWKEVDARQADLDAFVKDVAAMPAEEQVKAVAKKLRELNPGFDGNVTHTIEGGVVTDLQFHTDNVTDISPVRALSGLKSLGCHGSELGLGKLADLSPLWGMRFHTLLCHNSEVRDLSPLAGMPLTTLFIYSTQVSDLTPLAGMPVETLHCANTPVSDLTPVKGMPLTNLECSATQVSDLSPLAGLNLTALVCRNTRIADLSPLKGAPLTSLQFHSTAVTDLSPLKEMNLRVLGCDFDLMRDESIVRSIKSLETINGKPVAEFWKEVEGQQAERKP